MSTTDALARLRLMLLALGPTGEDGFEGLCADALATLTGLMFRLAKSGLQGGRDASSTPSRLFAIALEGKLYTNKLRLEDLAGKAVVAGHVLEGKVDLWVLAATSEVGDDTLVKLTDILEDRGVTLLALDWAERPLPPLAVLLASAPSTVRAWFATHAPSVDALLLTEILDAITADHGFRDQARRLRDTVCASQVGFDAARRKSEAWLRLRLHDRPLSEAAFGQQIAVPKAGTRAQLRTGLTARLSGLMTVDPSLPSVVAVLGDEGAGKTWLVAQWWAALPQPPILLFVSSPQAQILDAVEPVEVLARLLAQQDGSSLTVAIEGWRRRLSRWAAQDQTCHLRFVVVLDGLNEHATRKWAPLIRDLASKLAELGGLVLVTTRPTYWTRQVLPGLGSRLEVRDFTVSCYDDEELGLVLATRGLTVAALPVRVREFVRNPRVCAVALDLLERLKLQPIELTVDRLLLEYWAWRVRERPDLLVHTVADFNKLLRSHARAWLKQHSGSFERDDWATHSGAVKRLGIAAAVNDLTDIEEGRFLWPEAGNPEYYGFRAEALPFALALLVNDELKREAGVGQCGADEALDRILDPVRGFDLVGDTVSAAVGLACAEKGFPDECCRALIRTWLSLQNVGDDAFEAVTASVPTRPDAFLDIAEMPALQLGTGVREQSLSGLLLYTRDHVAVASALSSRLQGWLAAWSRQATKLYGDEGYQERQDERSEKIRETIGSFSASEAAMWDELTREFPEPPSMPLDRIAARLLASRPLAPFARGLLGWALVQAVASDVHKAWDELAWVVRLNPTDWVKTRDAVNELLVGVTMESSEPIRDAAAILLRLLGDRPSAARAEAFSPMTSRKGWRRAENFCETNPHDPDAAIGSNIDRARTAAGQLPPATIWNNMGRTADDHDLEHMTPPLARFDPAVITRLMRAIVGTVVERTHVELRQLSWRLPSLSPLLEADSVLAVQRAYDALTADPTRLPDVDLHWVSSMFVRTLAPHVTAVEQLALVKALPEESPLYVDVHSCLRPLPPEVLEQAMIEAESRSGTRLLARLLYLAAVPGVILTDRVRDVVQLTLRSGDDGLRASAAHVTAYSGDPGLHDAIIAQGLLDNAPVTGAIGGFAYERALAVAIASRKRVDAWRLVSPRFTGWVSSQLGGASLDRYADHLEGVISRLLEPIQTVAPPAAELFHGVSRDGLEASVWSVERDEDQVDDLGSAFEKASNLEAGAERHRARQKALANATRDYERALALEGAAAVAASPELHGMLGMIARDPLRVSSWMERILAINDERILGQVRNLGLVVAGAFATNDGKVAAAVMRHLRDRRPAVNVLIGQQRVSLYAHALFDAVTSPALDVLRRDAFDVFDDASLEDLILAAEATDGSIWLDEFVVTLTNASLPRDIALGLTIAGLRQMNPTSDRVFAADWGHGFLGSVATAARKNYERAEWARHWLFAAAITEDATEFWCYGQLAAGVVDRRFMKIWSGLKQNVLMRLHGSELYERLTRAAAERTKKRGDTLFGHKAPEPDMLMSLRDNETSIVTKH